MKKRMPLAAIAAVLATMLSAVAMAQNLDTTVYPGLNLGNQQLNMLIALEATQNVLTSLTSHIGSPLSGSWSGNVSATGWTLTFTGSINNQPASITENGTLQTSATWTDSGTVGSAKVTGSGTATVSGTQVKWQQTIGNGSRVPDVIGTVEAIACFFSPSNCKVVVLVSVIIRILTAFSEVDTTTGVLYGTSLRQPSLLTTGAQGSISFATGAVSYTANTLTFGGGGS